jgi:hypothetical protein
MDEDYPRTLMEFEKGFNTEDGYLDYLYDMQWPDGFVCSHCGSSSAWQWLHKLRRAMVCPGRDLLSGTVEVDETYVGGKRRGKRGRGAAGKALVVIAVEDKREEGIGRNRLIQLEDASSESLTPFVQRVVQLGGIIRTDDWIGNRKLTDAGFDG